MLRGETPGGLCVVGSVDGSSGFDSSSGQVGCVVVVVGDVPRRKMKLRADIQSTPRGSAGSDVRTPTPTRRYPYPLPPGGLWNPVLPYA